MPPPDRDIAQELSDVEIYNAKGNGLVDLDVYAVLDGWENVENPSAEAEWYYLYQERWMRYIRAGTSPNSVFSNTWY